MYVIEPYSGIYKNQIIDLILNIQQKEFNIPITLEGQHDLAAIETYYQKARGNFWMAVEDQKIIGTIGLLDIGNSSGAIRKMFVEKNHRGKEKAVAQNLYNELERHCREKNLKELFLGTIHVFQAAQKFYLKNGFSPIDKQSLPDSFPVMPVDDLFFRKTIN